MMIRYRYALLIPALFFLVSITSPLHAQVWQWVRRVGSGIIFDESNAISIDDAGNSYVAGRFTGEITLGSKTFSTSASAGVYLAKFTAGGNLQWGVGVVGGDVDVPSVCTDAAGNIFLAGGFSQTVLIGSGSRALTSLGGKDIFIAKFNPGGTLLWAKRAGGSESDYATGVAADSAGNCFITGSFTGSASFDTTELSSRGQGDVFIARYAPTGGLLWAAGNGGGGNDVARGISTDGNGNAYIVGDFSGSAVFGASTVISTGPARDVFAARYTPAGIPLWAASGGGLSDDSAGAITTDRFGNSYITGVFHDSLAFGGGRLAAAGSHMFLIKLDATGGYRWSAGGTSGGSDIGNAAAADGLGGSWLAGTYHDSVTLGGRTFPDPGGKGNLFVAHFANDGAVTYATSGGGLGADAGRGIAIDRNGDPRVVGSFAGSGQFGPYTLTGQGQSDGFIAAIGAQSTLRTGAISGSGFCPGTPISVPFATTGIFAPGNIFTAQLSDIHGLFDAPVKIGTVAGTGTGVIAARLPEPLAAGNYRIRVVAGDPVIVGSDNGSDVVVLPVPAPVINASDSTTLCQGGILTLDAGAGYSSYAWSTNATSRTITIADAGIYSVVVTNDGGCSGMARIVVSVNPAPLKPVITRIGVILESSPADGYQWYLGSTVIAGATDRRYYPATSGEYRVKILNPEGCSALSDAFPMTVSGVDDPAVGDDLRIAPTPGDGRLRIELLRGAPGAIRISVSDMLGRELRFWDDRGEPVTLRREIDISDLPRGAYLLRIEGAGRSWGRRIILQ
ncbi:MAG: C-terminal target protein [Chlorobi bacterium]|nr:C-terminal target protein [Chlorobiota bacterium]